MSKMLIRSLVAMAHCSLNRSRLLKSLPIVLLLAAAGCSHTMNYQWKRSIGELQITPIMPLSSNVPVGDVYRYLKKPPAFWKDGQVEPVPAFRLSLATSLLKTNYHQFPEMTLKQTTAVGVNIPIEGLAAVNSALNTKRYISVKAEGAYSVGATICDLREEFGIEQVKKPYRDKLKSARFYSNETSWRFLLPWNWQTYYKRNLVWLRIPAQVYYATNLTVTVTNGLSFTNALELKGAVAALNTGRITWSFTGESWVGIKQLDPPMAIGYRGLLLRVWLPKEDRKPALKKDYEIEEWLEGQ
ncbi:MAG: hypothetical protein WCT12_29505 [Verrucomicrobiota bacterium]